MQGAKLSHENIQYAYVLNSYMLVMTKTQAVYILGEFMNQVHSSFKYCGLVPANYKANHCKSVISSYVD